MGQEIRSASCSFPSALVNVGTYIFKGGIIGLSVLGKHIVVLNKTETIDILLEKRNAKYGDRPNMTIYTKWWAFAKKHLAFFSI